MSSRRMGNRKGQGTFEWVLILAFIALTTQALTTRTGLQIEMLFRVSSDAIGVEFRGDGQGEVVASSADEGGIAASGRTIRAKAGLDNQA